MFAYRQKRQDGWYPAFRSTLRILIPYKWRRRAVRLIRHRFGLFAFTSWLKSRFFRAPSPRLPRADSLCADFYEKITLLPRLSEAEMQAVLDRPIKGAVPRHPDVICFSIIDWSFRHQRPQQLMGQFAAQGHRVFYLNVSQFRGPYTHPRYSVREIGKNLYEVEVAAYDPLDIFRDVIEGKELKLLLASLDELRRHYNINEAIGYVMISSWGRVAIEARRRWGWRIIYDCMDEWESFPGIESPLLEMEKLLVQSCDLIVVTAQRLYEKWESYRRPMILARNAADYNFFAGHCSPNQLLSDARHPVIGYFGAIAEWFDLDLFVYAAGQRPEYTFVLLGGVFGDHLPRLLALPNVKVLGQQPYQTMPQYLYHFDVCIIPFKINPITEATDPVKLYEYLSGGKPVVSVRLPEIEQYRDYVYLADDREDFVAKLDVAVGEQTPALAAQRKMLVRTQTWKARYQQIIAGLKKTLPRVSIIIVTYNNLALTKLCLESIRRNTEYLNYETIVVDNNSTDGTAEYLNRLRGDDLTVILNRENLGFAKANNQGLSRAAGDYLVLLNNDTVVPPGWLSRLVWHLRDLEVGLVGPMTNFVGNEAKVDVPYLRWEEMESFAQEHTWAFNQKIAEIQMLAMFCVAMRRELWEKVGALDEQFGIGMFEDDDYSIRTRRLGYRVICAADVFVHHVGQASFGKLIENGDYARIFAENRGRYEAKWGVTWEPHQNGALKLNPHHPSGQ
jgi:GT2 family glycosyltransferase/glycosyltransferase involved in cell wall biosynthesis